MRTPEIVKKIFWILVFIYLLLFSVIQIRTDIYLVRMVLRLQQLFGNK